MALQKFLIQASWIDSGSLTINGTTIRYTKYLHWQVWGSGP
jgi:hypothetical protein